MSKITEDSNNDVDSIRADRDADRVILFMAFCAFVVGLVWMVVYFATA